MYWARVLNPFPQWARWAMPHLSAGWILPVVPIWLVQWVPFGYTEEGVGQPRSNLTLQGQGGVAYPCGKKGEWLGPKPKPVGRRGCDLILIQMMGRGHTVAAIGSAGLGVWKFGGGRVTILMATAPLLPNFPSHGELCRLHLVCRSEFEHACTEQYTILFHKCQSDYVKSLQSIT